MNLTTVVGGYKNLVVSAAAGESILATGATTDFYPTLPDPGTDALKPKDLKSIWSGEDGHSTEANGIVLNCYGTIATANGTCEMALYGIADGGAPERIADIVWTFGTAVRSAGVYWADTVTITNDWHVTTLKATDSGNEFIAKLSFDTTGYRYLYEWRSDTADLKG